MKSYLLRLLFIISFVLVSCQNQAQDEGMEHKVYETELQPKIEIWNTWQDSLMVYVYVPLEYKLTNNFKSKIRLTTTFWSKEKANINDAPTYWLSLIHI